MGTPDLKEALQDLIGSPGWAAFLAHVDREWGAGGQRFEAQLTSFADSREDDALVLQQIRQIAVARREILRLLAWPQERLKVLVNAAQASDVTGARPAMPLELVGQSRRGGL